MRKPEPNLGLRRAAVPACPGDEQFVGGTGKYQGISGNTKFQGNFIGTTGAGWSDWSGGYRIP